MILVDSPGIPITLVVQGVLMNRARFLLVMMVVLSLPVLGDTYRRTPVMPADLFTRQAENTAPVPPSLDSPDWHHRMYVESYRRYGIRDDRWDAYAETALALDASDLSGRTNVAQEIIRDAYATAMTAGCPDPLVIYRHLRAKEESEELERTDRRISYSEAAVALAQSRYPAFVKCWCFVRAANAQPPPHGGLSITQRGNMALLLDAVLDLVPVLLADRDMPALEIGALIDYYSKTYRKRYGDRETGYERIFEAFYDHAPENKLLMLTLRANFFRSYAWEARGHRFSYAVVDDNWELYGDRLQEALDVLLEIWDLNPHDADVAAQIQQLYAQRCDPEAEKWYERALAIDPAHYRARSIKMHFLQPKWCGSRDELIAFGRQCYASAAWEQRVPFLLVGAHEKVAASLPRESRREYFSQTNVWADLYSVYAPYLQRYPDSHWDRSRLAFLAKECGQWKTAEEQVRLLGTNVRVRAFGGASAYSNAVKDIERNVRGETDPGAPDHGAMLAAVVDGNVERVRAALGQGIPVDLVDDAGNNLLWRAVKADQMEVVQLLVEHGADADTRSPRGEHILFPAVRTGDKLLVDYLIGQGANPSSWDAKKEFNVLTSAIQRRDPGMVELLINRGARIDVRDKRKNTALNKAASIGYPEMITLLHEYGADLETRNSFQYTPLITAANSRKKSAVIELLRLGAQVDAMTTLDTTALANASYRGYADIMEVLLDAGANIDIVNKQETKTPLMYTAENGHIEATALLLKRGADRTVRDRYGKTAAEIARERGHEELAKLIEGWPQ